MASKKINDEKKREEECRLCGSVSTIQMNLGDKITGSYCCKDFVAYFCRVEVSTSDNHLPQGVCLECYGKVIAWCQFSTKLEKHQKTLKTRTPSTATAMNKSSTLKRQREAESSQGASSADKKLKKSASPLSSHVKKRRERKQVIAYRENSENSQSSDDDDDDEEKEEEKKKSIPITATTPKAEAGTAKVEGRTKECLAKVMSLFKKDLNSRKEQSFEKIAIKDSLVQRDGKIPREWLARYKNFVTWQDLPHECVGHCPKRFKSFNSLLMHYDESKIPVERRGIRCSSCGEVFKNSSYLSKYINHVDKVHYNHLKFGCLFCKEIFVNALRLNEHIMREHGELNFKLYPCLNCGMACPTMDTLVQHKTCHDDRSEAL